MIEKINPMFYVWGEKPTITAKEIAQLKEKFPALTQDYLDLLIEASNLEVQLIEGSKHVEPGTAENLYIIYLLPTVQAIENMMTSVAVKRVCGTDKDAVAIATDGGDSLFIYMHGDRGWGFYLMNLTNGETTWVAPTLGDLLIDGTGIEACIEHSYG